MRRLLPLALLLSACSPDLLEIPTGSSTLAADPVARRIAVANTWEDSLSIVDVDAGTALEVDLGVRPTRVARLGDRAFVTLRGERSLVEVDLDAGKVLQRVDTGPEPFGVVASPDGQRLFVSISMADRVEERDATTLEVLRSFPVPNEPRWLAVHPDGHLLVVASARGEAITLVHLDDGSTETRSLPGHVTEVSGAVLQGEVRLAARVTGDPVFRADGKELVIPALYVDNRSGEVGGATDANEVPIPAAPYYRQNSSSVGMDRFNSTIVHFHLVDDGVVKPEATATSRVLDSSTHSRGEDVVRQSAITSITESPDGLGWLVTMEASDAVLLVDDRFRRTWRRRTRLAWPNAAVVDTARGPAGVAVFDTREVYVHEALARTVSDLDQRALRRNMKREVDRDEPENTPHTLANPVVEVAASLLDFEEEQGRNLFYDAVGREVGNPGVSCSTCHFDGRNDGLTWTLFNGPRNTPSLAAPVDESGVVTWNNPVSSVADEARFTVKHRMGGQEFRNRHADRLAAFVRTIPLPDLPEVDQDAVTRGQAVFEREDVGCAECHSGPHLTDGKPHDLYGLDGVRTRSLVGIASSAPYLHDGSAGTLREVIDSAGDGNMGHTSHLSEAEKDDLEAYLRSL